MALKLISLLLVELLMMICFLSLQALAGLLNLPSLSSASSFIFPIKEKAVLYGISHRFLLLEDGYHSEAKAYEAPSPSHHPLLPKGSSPRKPDFPSHIHFAPSFNNDPSPATNHHRNVENSRKRNTPSENSNRKAQFPFPAIPRNRVNAPSPSPSANNPAKNKGCENVKCAEPLTYAARGSPCGCVLPLEVSLRFDTSLYNFFPLVPELSRDLAEGLALARTQVRILGADAQQQKTTVLVNLVPLDKGKFDAATLFSIYKKLWTREVSLSFGSSYEVLYVRYKGLPSSPPLQPAIEAQPYTEGENGGRGPLKPIGVDITAQKRKNGSERSAMIVVVLSAITAFVVIIGLVALSLSKAGFFDHRQEMTCRENKESSGGRFLALRSKQSSGSASFGSSLVAFATSTKVFTVAEMERATDGFSDSRILGEGGFGVVYGGVLEDGRKVAVKVLKRDNNQGSREFLAEVEMLGRLHHRNLVKLIGICAEESLRCLVYELVPNGSVESHLHGADKEVASLDWPSRLRIALGAARGLAYLHEDSSPRVIHRDFKSSNILLEHDYTPKLSDFGLARAAVEDESKHVSTHVMGTFGYLAPEYAMTGHVLVKSDVYSYGVVLLELLTGRKPVDMTQPSGQENLVSWARPLLSTKEGLEALVDPAIKTHAPSENFARVAAVAAMMVHPEPSHRPFMGEVVQALRLMCDELDGTAGGSMSWRRDEVVGSFSIDAESKHIRITNELLEDLEREESSGKRMSDVDPRGGSASEYGFESFGREFNSAPLKVERKRRVWWRLGRFSRGSMSEHEFLTRM